MREIINSKKKNKIIFFSCLAFILITHSYRWMNTMYSHDSLLILQHDWKWQISLGRIFNPLYVWLRGYILAPMNIGILASIYIIVSAAFIIYMLKLKQKTSVILCCGFLATFETITFVNSTFLLSLDLDMLALLFSVLGAYFFTGEKSLKRYAAGVICITVMLGLFQSYIEVAILLICLEILRETLEGGDAGKLLIKGLRCIGLIILSGILYYICLKIVMGYTGISHATSINGLAKMNNLTIPYAISLAKDAYKFTLKYLLYDSMIYHHSISRWVYRILALFTVSGIAWIVNKRRLSKGNIALIIFLLMIMPLGGNCVYVLSLGLKHSLMNYAFVFFSVMAVMVYDLLSVPAGKEVSADETESAGIENKVEQENSRTKDFRFYATHVIPVLCAILIFNHVLFANQWYTRTDLYSRAGVSFMTRLITDIEEVDGYEVGKTPVLILGHIDDNPASYTVEGFEIVSDPMVGTLHHLAISYYQTYLNFFHYILGYSINMVPLNEVANYIDDPEINAMPVYPADGSVSLINGVLVVRLSEDLRPEELR